MPLATPTLTRSQSLQSALPEPETNLAPVRAASLFQENPLYCCDDPNDTNAGQDVTNQEEKFEEMLQRVDSHTLVRDHGWLCCSLPACQSVMLTWRDLL